MKKVTQEQFLKILKEDQVMAKKLADYLGDISNEEEIAKKTFEFAKNEGYEVKLISKLDENDLENVSGGGYAFGDVLRSLCSVGHTIKDLINTVKNIKDDWT